MARMLQRPGHTFEVQTEPIHVSTGLPQPNPTWTYTDHAGHPHAYGTKDTPYPTLTVGQGEPYWCDECDDEHVPTWLECPLCGERITPGTFIDTTPTMIPGRTTYLIDGQSVSPEVYEAAFADANSPRGEAELAADDWTEDSTVVQYGLRLRDGTLLTFDSRAERDGRQAEFERAEWEVTPLTRRSRVQRTDWKEDRRP
jgi:hypothetical protein